MPCRDAKLIDDNGKPVDMDKLKERVEFAKKVERTQRK
jgi:hypothetical protein